jgi:hypothetical protein
MGYAEGCGRMPRDRMWDSVRFAARTVGVDGESRNSGRIQIRYVCENGHRPAESGVLVFDVVKAQWVEQHRDGRVQRLAECFLESYAEKRKRQEVTRAS